jgi:hypothetical protein
VRFRDVFIGNEGIDILLDHIFCREGRILYSIAGRAALPAGVEFLVDICVTLHASPHKVIPFKGIRPILAARTRALRAGSNALSILELLSDERLEAKKTESQLAHLEIRSTARDGCQPGFASAGQPKAYQVLHIGFFHTNRLGKSRKPPPLPCTIGDPLKSVRNV